MGHPYSRIAEYTGACKARPLRLRQVTDAHLLALALRRGGRLATFDRILVDLAPEGTADRVVMLGGG
jgi:predicted nucleic acid-binding protein